MAMTSGPVRRATAHSRAGPARWSLSDVVINTERMSETSEVPDEAPATWENVVVGKTMEAVGHVIGDEQMAEEGEEQAEIAHEVRAEFDDEHEA